MTIDVSNIHYATLMLDIGCTSYYHLDYMMANENRCVQHHQKLVAISQHLLNEDDPLSIKARDDLGLNEFQELVCLVGTKWDIMCDDSFTTNYNHQRYMKLVWKIHEVARGKGPLS